MLQCHHARPENGCVIQPFHKMQEAIDYMAEIGFDPVYGARPIQRTVKAHPPVSQPPEP